MFGVYGTLLINPTPSYCRDVNTLIATMDVSPSIFRILRKIKFTPLIFVALGLGEWYDKQANDNMSRYR